MNIVEKIKEYVKDECNKHKKESKDGYDFWNEHILKEELQNKSSHQYVAKQGDKIVGFAGIWKAVDDVHITNIVVRKSERQHGIGSALLEHLIEEGKKMKDIQF